MRFLQFIIQHNRHFSLLSLYKCSYCDLNHIFLDDDDVTAGNVTHTKMEKERVGKATAFYAI